jgi:hypothetical protein
MVSCHYPCKQIEKMEKLLKESGEQLLNREFCQKIAQSFKWVLLLALVEYLVGTPIMWWLLFRVACLDAKPFTLACYFSAVAHLVVLGNLLLNGLRCLQFLFFIFFVFPIYLCLLKDRIITILLLQLRRVLSVLWTASLFWSHLKVHSWFQNQQQDAQDASKNMHVLPKACPPNRMDGLSQMPQGPSHKCLLLDVLSIVLYIKTKGFYFLHRLLQLCGCVWTVEITCQISWLLVCLLMSKWFLESMGDPLLLNSWCLGILKYTVVT